MTASCGKREQSKPSAHTTGHPPALQATPAREIPDMSDVRSVAEVLRMNHNHTGKTVTNIIDIRFALVDLAEKSGSSYGECLCQVYEILCENASDAEAVGFARSLSSMGFGDQDLLLSSLAAAPHGPLLRYLTANALGCYSQTITREGDHWVVDNKSKSEDYDLEKVYSVMAESSSREMVAVDWVQRVSRADGLVAAMALVDSLQSAGERKAAVTRLCLDLHAAQNEGKSVSDADISALRVKVRAAGVSEGLLEGFPQTQKQP